MSEQAEIDITRRDIVAVSSYLDVSISDTGKYVLYIDHLAAIERAVLDERRRRISRCATIMTTDPESARRHDENIEEYWDRLINMFGLHLPEAPDGT